MKKLANFKDAKILSKVEQKSINGGLVSGNCVVGCRNIDANGDHIIITNAPDCSQATMDFACQNQGGANTCSCS